MLLFGARDRAGGALRLAALCLAAVGLLAVSSWNAVQVPSEAPPERDGRHYFTAAWNMAADGVFGIHRRDGTPIRGAAREPLYPTLVAGVLIADRLLTGSSPTEEVDHSCVLEGASPACGAAARQVKLLNGALYLAVVALTVVAARRWLPWGASLAAGWLVALSAAVVGYIDTTYTEILATLLLLAASLAAARAVEARPRPGRVLGAAGWAAAAGAALGLLALTKALFLWATPVVGGLLWLALLRRGRGREVALRGAVALLAVGLALPGMWMARNAAAGFGGGLTTGADAVRATRLSFDTMRADEAVGAVVFWSTPTYGPGMAEALFPPSQIARLPRLAPGGLYEGHEAVREEIRREGLGAVVRERAVPHVLLTPLILWRGTVPWAEFGVPDRALSIGMAASEAVGRLLLLALVATTWLDLRGRRWDRLAFAAPVLVATGLYAAFTHFLPRYSAPMLPVLAILLLVAGGRAAERLRGRRRRRART